MFLSMTSDVAAWVLADFLEILQIPEFAILQPIFDEMATVALFLVGLWVCVPVFFKAMLVQAILAHLKKDLLGQYMTWGYLVGALFGLRSLFSENASEVIEQVSETDNEIMFTAFAVDGPSLAIALMVVWYFSHDRVVGQDLRETDERPLN